MEANRSFRSLSADEIEQLKADHRIDDRIADILIPSGDSVRGNAQVNSKLKDLVRDKVDPWLIELLRGGGHKVPRELFNRTPSRAFPKRNADALSKQFRAFLDSVARKANGGQGLSRKEQREYARQMRVTVEEAVWREVGDREPSGKDEKE